MSSYALVSLLSEFLYFCMYLYLYSMCIFVKPDKSPISMSSSALVSLLGEFVLQCFLGFLCVFVFHVYLYLYLYFMCIFVKSGKSPMSMSSSALVSLLSECRPSLSCCLCRQLVFAIHWEHWINLDLFWCDLK